MNEEMWRKDQKIKWILEVNQHTNIHIDKKQ